MSKTSIIRCSILLFLLVIIAASASAQDLPFTTNYDEDFVEGEHMTKGFGELDKLVFTYMGENHTFRLMSISHEAQKCDIIVDKHGVEINEDETLKFSLLPGSVWDLEVKLKRVDEDSASFRLELSDWLVQDDDISDDNSTNTTNTTSTTDANSTDTNSTNDNNSSSGTSQNTSASSQNTAPGSQSSQNTQANTAAPESSQINTTASSYIGGGTVVNINFNITLPQGSGIGFLIIVAIVLGGLLVYTKVKKRMTGKDVVLYKRKKKR